MLVLLLILVFFLIASNILYSLFKKRKTTFKSEAYGDLSKHIKFVFEACEQKYFANLFLKRPIKQLKIEGLLNLNDLNSLKEFINYKKIYNIDLSKTEIITIENGVFKNDVFAYCCSLRSVILPESITSIANGAFEGCSNLETVTVNSNNISIGDYAFKGCHNLRFIKTNISLILKKYL